MNWEASRSGIQNTNVVIFFLSQARLGRIQVYRSQFLVMDETPKGTAHCKQEYFDKKTMFFRREEF